MKDGNEYRELAKFQISRFNAALNVGFEPYAPVVVSVPATVGRNFRLELDQKVESYELENIELLSQPLVERYPEKLLAKMYQTPLPYWHEYQWREQPVLDDASLAVDPNRVLDISSFLKGDNLNGMLLQEIGLLCVWECVRLGLKTVRQIRKLPVWRLIK